MHLAHDDGKLTVEIDDPTPDTSLAELRESLAHDAERLAALAATWRCSRTIRAAPASAPDCPTGWSRPRPVPLGGVQARRAVTGRRTEGLLAAAYSVLLAATVVVSLAWLAIGVLVRRATYSPTVATALTAQAAEGSTWRAACWARSRTASRSGRRCWTTRSPGEPVIAGVLLFLGMRTWVTQLLAVAIDGSDVARSLQATRRPSRSWRRPAAG